jgi:hypothetical protein
MGNDSEVLTNYPYTDEEARLGRLARFQYLINEGSNVAREGDRTLGFTNLPQGERIRGEQALRKVQLAYFLMCIKLYLAL